MSSSNTAESVGFWALLGNHCLLYVGLKLKILSVAPLEFVLIVRVQAFGENCIFGDALSSSVVIRL